MLLDIDPSAAIVLFATIVLPILLLVWYTTYYNRTNRETQRDVTDQQLLRLFANRPGGILSAKAIAEQTGLRKMQVTSRLTALKQGGMLRYGVSSNGTKAFYELTAPLEVRALQLSPEPFLTVEDLQKIFQAYDHNVSSTDLVMATNLPWTVLQREMKHFATKGIVETVIMDRPGDGGRHYILHEAYIRKEPARDEALNEELRQLLVEERFLV